MQTVYVVLRNVVQAITGLVRAFIAIAALIAGDYGTSSVAKD